MAYNIANSLSPIMFKKHKKSDQGGTRNERWRSKSVENIMDTPDYAQVRADKPLTGPPWKELILVSSEHPVVACVLPYLAMDFVASTLLAVGATPLITEDPEDMEKDLDSCKAVVVDMSAPQIILEAFLEKFEVGCKPLILVASGCGTCDRKAKLAEQIIERSGPSFITGKMVDIHTLAMVILERSDSRLGSDEENPPSMVPKVILSNDEQPPVTTSLPPAMRRAKMRRASSPASNSVDSPKSKSCKASSPSPLNSPRTSPPDSGANSPRTSPVLKRRGIQKLLMKKKKQASSDAPLKRVPTALPRLRMKGQFRDTKNHDIKPEDGLESAQNLAAHTNAFIHIFETSVVTSGEVIVEINNNQLGMGNLHSVLVVCGAITGAVLACIPGECEDDITLKNCVHALALYCVAAEEGGCCAISACDKGVVSPGTLRVKFLDALHYLDERTVHSKAELFAHSEGVKCAFH